MTNSPAYQITSVRQSNQTVLPPQNNGFLDLRSQYSASNEFNAGISVLRRAPPKAFGTMRLFTASTNDGQPPELTPDMYLTVLENSAAAPWLALEHIPAAPITPEDKMKRAYLHVFQIVMYLGRPQKEEEAVKFLMVSPAYL
jgi:hypothetical protein